MKFSYDKQKYVAKEPMKEDNEFDIIPGELFEKRKTSKSKELPFAYKCQNTIKNFDSEITCLLFLRSVNIFAITTLSPNIELWEFDKKEIDMNIVSILTGHIKSITCLKEFLNLNCLASCSLDNTLKLWDISKKECIKTLNYYSKSILTCCYKSTQNMEIFTAGENMEIIVWENTKSNFNYKPKVKILAHKKSIDKIYYIDEYNLLVSGGRDNCLCFFDCNNNYSCVNTIEFGSQIYCLKYYKKRLVVSCSDGNILFININILRVCKSVQFGNVGVCNFDLIEDQYLIMGCEDGKARIWKFCTEYRTLLKGHKKAVIGIVVMDSNQNYILTASKDCTLKIWEKHLNYDYQ